MSGLDIALIIGGIAVLVIEGFRGFGRAMFDSLALFGALFLANLSFHPLASSLDLAQTVGGNLSAAYLICFMGYSAIGLVISHFVYGSILINLGMFDHFMGVCAGVAVAIILAHGTVRTIDLSYTGTRDTNMVLASSVGNEALNFNAYHGCIDMMSSSTESQRTVPTN